jgi:hypothetical protein
MPSFKPKANKKIKVCKKYTTTLDGKHKEMLNDFAKDDQDVIPNLKEERYSLKKQLELETDLPIEQIMEIKDRIEEINISIKELKSKKNNYFLDNSKYIFEYFENKKNIENNDETINNNKTITTKNQLVFNIFKIQKQNEDSNTNNNANDTKNIVQKYLSNVDESFLDINSFVRPTDICQSCFKGELIPLDDEGQLICNVCFINTPYLVENDKPSYKEPPKEVCFYAYKKINHMKEIIAQFQGKETTQILPEVIEKIKQQIKKERINIEQLTYIKTKEILKKLELSKYYEHIAFIKNKLGIPPPVLSPELEESLYNYFIEIQSPYAQSCPDYRINFLNYYYVLYKLLELLGETKYLPDIPLLKDREKLIEQDEIWKKICNILCWEFIPTV